MITQFDDLTIRQLKKLFKEWRAQNQDAPTAEEMLNDLNAGEKR